MDSPMRAAYERQRFQQKTLRISFYQQRFVIKRQASQATSGMLIMIKVHAISAALPAKNASDNLTIVLLV